jgi:UDP-glucose 4-epimerase
MEQPGMRYYNIGTGTGYSVHQVCEKVEEITGRKVPVRISGRRPGDPGVLYASPHKVMEELGWKPTHSSLQEILSSAWQWKQRKG